MSRIPRLLLGLNVWKSKFLNGLFEVLSVIGFANSILRTELGATTTVFSADEMMAPIMPRVMKKNKIDVIIMPTMVASVYFKKLFMFGSYFMMFRFVFILFQILAAGQLNLL